MPYTLRADETVPDGVRRCAREQLERAVEELTTGVHDDPVNAVHEARKALKKTRSLLRLGRGSIGRDTRRRENAAFRGAARELSSARDAEVMLDAVDDLADRFAGRVPHATFDTIRRGLEAERDSTQTRLLESGVPGQVADELKAALAGLDDWSLRRGGWTALEPGLARSYARGRRLSRRLGAHPTVEDLHEWRKRTKDLWYHLRILKPNSPGIVGGQADEADKLGKLLGDDHDLAVLRAALEHGSSDLAVDLDPVFELVDHRRDQLQAEAVVIGRRLYAEPPKVFARRLRRYWKASRGGRRPVALAV